MLAAAQPGLAQLAKMSTRRGGSPRRRRRRCGCAGRAAPLTVLFAADADAASVSRRLWRRPRRPNPARERRAGVGGGTGGRRRACGRGVQHRGREAGSRRPAATGRVVRVRRCSAWRPSSRSWSWRSCLRAAAAQLRRAAPASLGSGARTRRRPALRAQHQHRRDGLVLLARARRPERRPPARARRALLLDVRLRREGAPARQGHRDERAGLRPRRSRGPRRRRADGDRRRRQRGHGGCVRAPRRSPPARTGLAGLDVQRGPVPRGAGTRGGRSRRRRPDRGRRDDDEHLADRRAGVRLRRTGSLYRPKGAPATAWPRYNRLRGKGNDADFNGAGNRGYGAYGENVGIGNLDDDAQLEIVVTFDNHQINVFNHDGTSVLASPWFRNRDSRHAGRRLGWGQFIRWLDPAVEARHYHEHAGPWPDVRKTMWLQWTDSPPSVADLDRDGRNEVIGVPNAEQKEPYETQAYAFMVLDGAYGDGSRSARRHEGFTTSAAVRQAGRTASRGLVSAVGDPGAHGRRHLRRSAAGDRGLGARRLRLRRQPYGQAALALRLRPGRAEDVRLRGRGRRPQPGRQARARLRHVRARPGLRPARRALGGGKAAARHPTPAPGRNGNGIGVPAAPSIGDLDGDGTLEIVLSTFDHGIDVFRVPGSGTNLLPWPTGRGSLLRNGTGPATAP